MEKKQEFTVIIEKGEDGYLISEVVELPGCHTQAKSQDELLKRTKDAIKLYLEATRGNEDFTPSIVLGFQKLFL